MAKARIYEIAKEFSITNKALLEKLKEMSIPAKNHMSILEDSEVARVKDALFGKKEKRGVVEEKRIKTTVIRRRKVAKKAPEPVEIEKEVVEKEKPTEEVVSPVPEEPEVDKDHAIEEQKPAPAPEEPVVEAPKPEKKAKPKKRQKKEETAKIISMPKPAIPGVPVEPKTKEEPPEEKAIPFEPKTKEEPPEEKAIPYEEKAKPSKREKGAKVTELEKVKKKPKKRLVEIEQEKKFFKKKSSFRNKAVIEGAALYDRRGRGKKKRAKGGLKAVAKTAITTPKAIKRRLKIDDAIAVSELAKRMGVKSAELIKVLIGLGIMANLNQALDFETASLLATEFDYEVERAVFAEETIVGEEADDPAKLKPRPPVVTIMGHVDHGKTSLLDAIRNTNVTAGEAGGITQHIGAYHVKVRDSIVSFLDTPGHEAFTAMRARGADVTDIVVLVVAADDGVMPQTVEAINHSRAANVPIIVAVNKIDKPNAEPDRIKRELADQGLSPEEWGGDTIFVEVSAKQGEGVDSLLEMILLQAEVMELKANPDKLARGRVVEASLDIGRGPVATVLVQGGTLHPGDAVVCGVQYGKIRAMRDSLGNSIDKAGPSLPVEIVGLSGVPMAGDELVALVDEKKAKQVSLHRLEQQRAKALAKTSKLSLESLYEQMKEGEIKDLNLIVRADVQGSIEALADALNKIPSPEVKINIVHSATGTITESDIMLASASNAIVIGFNVRPNSKVEELANQEDVDIRFYDVIYNVINDIKGAIVGMMASTYEEHIYGKAEVRETFVIPKVGTIAGCYVTEGKVVRNARARLLRDGVVIYDGKLDSLRRFKDDVKEVQTGYECGIGITNYNNIKVDDVIECYYEEEIKPKL
jgi:translation initiation factor IF-2